MGNITNIAKHISKSVNNLQIKFIENIPAGNFNPGGEFLVKNITDAPVKVTGKLINTPKIITTVLYPGWNVEIFKELMDVKENTLQYGK